jgi:CubicO group peptidase (beta-lactamase class C family)
MRRLLHLVLVLTPVLTAHGQETPPAGPLSPGSRSLRSSEPAEAIIADLESFIPAYMRRQEIPGVAMALILGGEIVWTEGFGVTSTFTGESVTPETLFEVASNSKAMTAYLALRLVDQGLLSLDDPLNTYLSQPWLPASEHRQAITLRHVLSHRSGLGASISLSRASRFAPGDGYYYSGIGFMYVQHVIEEVTGRSFQAVAGDLLFAPLEMSTSSFVSTPENTPRTASGHLHAGLPALGFAIPFVVSLAVVGLPGLVVLRIRTGRWRPRRRMVIVAAAVAYLLSLLPALSLLGRAGLLEFFWLIALCGLVLTTGFAGTVFTGHAVLCRLFPDSPRRRWALTALWGLLILAGLILVVSRTTNVPVPKWPATDANAAGTVRAPVGEVAAFLMELSDPRHLSPEMAAEMRTAQVRLSPQLSWGLGVGIQHSRHGDALWHWGQHLDFQSVMIIYPAQGIGAVVCTNSDLLAPDVALEIAHRALGGEIEPIRRAVHLEFNTR